MSRPLVRALGALLTLAAVGCQDYSFNPVGHCVIQPGTERFTLSSISTADVLFVVDDSGSMGAEQVKLAGGFDLFIQNLDDANAQRAAAGLVPFDFHIAVTTTSVFWNPATAGRTCRSDCPDAVGQKVCCAGSAAVRQPMACTPGSTTCPAGTTCGINCLRLKGENYCCNQADGSFPAGSLTDVIPCALEGVDCGIFERHYNVPTNAQLDQWPFPQGDFVSYATSTSANPRVLHFDKQLYTGSANRQGFTRDDLKAAFKGGTFRSRSVSGNAVPGTSGSGQEQGFQAARLAVEKMLAGKQRDTYDLDGNPTYVGTTHVATAPAEWLHPGAKLVLVFVGDEDDCSSPRDPSAGVVMVDGTPGSDSCVQDATLSPPLGHKEFDVSSWFADYVTGLGRSVGAAFIVSSAQTSCSGLSCTPGTCCQPDCPTPGVCSQDTGPTFCGGQAPGTRFFAAASALRARGADVVQGSICDPRFDLILNDIAEIVKPPQTLPLPSLPAESQITLLRIAKANGDTRKLCGAALAPTLPAYTLSQAQDTGADWWFTADANAGPPYVDPTAAPTAAAPSRFVYLNPKGSCIANPGETYSADYLGVVPAGGCTDDADCAAKLGGQASAWSCYVPAGLSTGTCTCRPGP